MLRYLGVIKSQDTVPRYSMELFRHTLFMCHSSRGEAVLSPKAGYVPYLITQHTKTTV